MMKLVTVVTPFSPEPLFEKPLLAFTKSDLVDGVVVVHQEPVHLETDRSRLLIGGPVSSHETLRRLLDGIRTKYLLLLLGVRPVLIQPGSLERILEVAESTKAGLVYSDFYDENNNGKTLHPVNDYQLGSVRDDFDFGAMILFSVPAIHAALKKCGIVPGVKFAGLYDLRLKVSIDHSVYHLREPLYSVTGTSERDTKGVHEAPLQDQLFAYVDPSNRDVQKEMETVFTDYLMKIGAYLPPVFKEIEQPLKSFPVEASVIIPVRNRKDTVAQAVESALSQETDFSFNVIVVDNYSTDGTTAVLSGLTKLHSRLKHIIPERTDLGIGGCWNAALQDRACGRYAVQLDSDDLYSSPRSLQNMVNLFRQGNYGMVIGSYTLVNSRLEEIPPGLIDHREWTDDNGRNNALRINGLGAPRGFNAGLMRRIGFLNVSYGEDYAASLRICREYRIGRIFESLYLCRRWSGNTDAGLSLEEKNRYDAFKDKIRTDEILARQEMNQGIY